MEVTVVRSTWLTHPIIARTVIYPYPFDHSGTSERSPADRRNPLPAGGPPIANPLVSALRREFFQDEAVFGTRPGDRSGNGKEMVKE